MFQLAEIIGMAGLLVLAILLLAVWADVRKGKKELRQLRREFLRSQMGERNTGSGKRLPPKEEKEKEKQIDEEAPLSAPSVRTFSLKPGEEQVLREILADFLS